MLNDLVKRAWVEAASELAATRAGGRRWVRREVPQASAEEQDLALEEADQSLEPLDGRLRFEQRLAARQLDLDDARQQVRQHGRIVRDVEVAAGRRVALAGQLRLGGGTRVGLRVGLAGLDLDADVEHLGRFTVAGTHEVQIPDKTADGTGRQPLGPALITDLVVERGHLRDQVRLALRVDRVDREPASGGGEQVVATVRVSAGLADLGERANAGQRGDALGAHLPAIADEHDAERLAGVEAMAG